MAYPVGVYAAATSTWNGYPFQYPLPGYPADTRVPGYHSIPVLFFHKVTDTLFLSDNLNTRHVQ